MKKIWVYLLGILTGIALTFLFAVINNKAKSSDDITFFDEPGEIITTKSHSGWTKVIRNFKVFQVLEDGVALAIGNELSSYDLIVLLWNDQGEKYYDNQDVVAPRGKCFRQIGIYKYESKDERYRTVPVVTIMDDDFEEVETETALFAKPISENKMTFFDEPGVVMSDKSYKVTRVLEDGSALAKGKSQYGSSYWGLDVLLWDEDANYYDDQIVKAPNGKCFRQIGIYKSGASTYPIVALKNSTGNKQKSESNKQKSEPNKQKSEPNNATQNIEQGKDNDLDVKITEPSTTTQPTNTETNSPKLDRNKAYKLVRD